MLAFLRDEIRFHDIVIGEERPPRFFLEAPASMESFDCGFASPFLLDFGGVEGGVELSSLSLSLSSPPLSDAAEVSSELSLFSPLSDFSLSLSPFVDFDFELFSDFDFSHSDSLSIAGRFFVGVSFSSGGGAPR